jgi:hypothetical protein
LQLLGSGVGVTLVEVAKPEIVRERRVVLETID